MVSKLEAWKQIAVQAQRSFRLCNMKINIASYCNIAMYNAKSDYNVTWKS